MLKNSKMQHPRNLVLQEVRNTLLGPSNPEEVLTVPPSNLYVTGILYPQMKEQERTSDGTNDPNSDALETINNEVKNKREDVIDIKSRKAKDSSEINSDELTLVTDFSPKAMGLSFIVSESSEFQIEISFGTYTEAPLNEEAADKLKDGGTLHKGEKKFIRKHFESEPIIVKIASGNLVVNHKYKSTTGTDDYIKLLLNESPKASLSIVKRPFTISDKENSVVTVTLVNEETKDKGELRKPEHSLFQSEIVCKSDSAVFLPFTDKTELEKVNDPEELSNKLLYADYQKFAAGHGVSATWEDAENPKLPKRRLVKTEYLPQFEVLDNDFQPSELKEAGVDQVLLMKKLSGEGFSEEGYSRNKLIEELDRFVGVYSDWIKDLPKELESLIEKLSYNEIGKVKLKNSGDRNIELCKALHKRMADGVELLRTNDKALMAFSDANQAMFVQRLMASFTRNRHKEHGEDIWPTESSFTRLPDYSTWPAEDEKKEDQYVAKWRPFQLAFLLSQIPGMVDKSSDDRETVDLIWFTTGGGKTEAYLGLIAMYLFYRRLEANTPDEGAGVTAFMRYTLRLLIKQQYDRAVPLVLACEQIRRKKTKIYGSIPYSIGIWVGSSLTPNTSGGSKDNSFEPSFRLLKDPTGVKPKYSLPIYECPACGTSLLKKKIGRTVKGELGCFGLPGRGFDDEAAPFNLHCTNQLCDFHVKVEDRGDSKTIRDTGLGFPIYFIDEDVYDVYPSIVFSTIDKLASINWNTDCFKLFNLKKSKQLYPPPELIIQDELHLISSALGTIYGVYEILVDYLCGSENRPKIVAATATVRNAESQCRLLYGRNLYQQFPAPGISADDSFYSRKKKLDIEKYKNTEPQGRLYTGFQPSGFTNTVAQIRLVGALMQKVPSLNLNNQELDSYYTNLVYFNTIKELGKFRTLLMDDIPANKKFLSKYFGEYGTLDKGYRSDEFAELSSQLNAEEISTNLKILESGNLPEQQLTTVSDVFNQLGIRMRSDYSDGGDSWQNEFEAKFNSAKLFEELVIDGFEKGSEKETIGRNRKRFEDFIDAQIQKTEIKVPHLVAATNMISVGIDIARFNVMQITGQPKSHAEYIQSSSRAGRSEPGLVITTFNPAKNRDRSHYEGFVDYHQGYYRYVESTSVTPYSKPALEKAMDAVCFALAQLKVFNAVSGKDNPVTWSDKLETFLNHLGEVICKRIENTVNGFEGFSSDEAQWKENVQITLEKLIQDWKSMAQLKPNLFYPQYGTFYEPRTPRQKQLQVQARENALYVMPDDRQKENGLKNKKACMTSMRNVEVSIPVKLVD